MQHGLTQASAFLQEPSPADNWVGTFWPRLYSRFVDAFWQRKLDELAAVPMQAELVPADGDKPGVDYFKVTMDNIRGSRIRRQLARPKAGGKLPAMLIVQWAGVYPLQKGWVTERAAEGWLALVKGNPAPVTR